MTRSPWRSGRIAREFEANGAGRDAMADILVEEGARLLIRPRADYAAGGRIVATLGGLMVGGLAVAGLLGPRPLLYLAATPLIVVAYGLRLARGGRPAVVDLDRGRVHVPGRRGVIDVRDVAAVRVHRVVERLYSQDGTQEVPRWRLSLVSGAGDGGEVALAGHVDGAAIRAAARRLAQTLGVPVVEAGSHQRVDRSGA